MRKLILCTLPVFLAGCATIHTVPQASHEDSVSWLTLACNKPYVLAQDCSWFSVATRAIVLNGMDVKVAASADGRIILVMDAHPFRDTMLGNPFTFNSKRLSDASNNSYYEVRKVLDDNAVEVIKVRAVKTLGDIYGYLLELAADGYSFLIPFTKQED